MCSQVQWSDRVVTRQNGRRHSHSELSREKGSIFPYLLSSSGSPPNHYIQKSLVTTVNRSRVREREKAPIIGCIIHACVCVYPPPPVKLLLLWHRILCFECTVSSAGVHQLPACSSAGGWCAQGNCIWGRSAFAVQRELYFMGQDQCRAKGVATCFLFPTPTSCMSWTVPQHS